MLAFGSDEGTIKLFDTIENQEITTLLCHNDPITSICFSQCCNIIASGSYDNTIKLWDTVTYQELATLRGHKHPIMSVCFSPNDNILASPI